MSDELVLMRSQNRMTLHQIRTWQVLGLLLVLAMLSLSYVGIAAKHPEKPDWELFELMYARLVQSPGHSLQVLLTLLLLFGIPQLSLQIYQHERLILDRRGIRYQSPFRGVFAFLKPSWCLSWPEIKNLSLNHYLVSGRLIIRPLQGKQQRVLNVPAWRRQEELERLWRLPLYVRLREIRRQRLDTEGMLQSSLLQYCQDIGGLMIDNPVHPELDFDLGKHPLTRVLLIVLFILIGYGVIDFIANRETYVSVPPIWWFVLGGAVVFFGLGFWLRRVAVPKINAWLLASLLAIVFGLDMYPGLLRINQATDSEGFHAQAYRHVATYRFAALQQHLPDIIFPADAYWRNLPKNTVMEFMLRRGKLGFYQIDMAPVYARMRYWDWLQRAKHSVFRQTRGDKL